MTNMEIPSFAIVGHPNKGKSSIVSTLAQDSSVAISPLSGTTVHTRVFPMRVDGNELYRLIDTPGFQRARAAMDWMQKHSKSTSDHAETVRRFVDQHYGKEQFVAECELLTPILQGAGILYVIDGSIPYGPEYDAEMEILRWTGQPSMALINQIGESQYFEEWQQPLSQYFKIVRIFNAKTASFERQIQLLTGFSELSDSWHQPLKKAAQLLKEQRQQRTGQAARCIAESILTMLGVNEVRPLKDKNDHTEIDKAKKALQGKLIKMEQKMRTEVESLFNYPKLERDEAALGIDPADLFSDRTWKLFGLSRDQLITTGMIGGAAGGALLDIGAGGLTMFLGSGIGAIVGGAGAWLGSQQLVDTKILGLPMGGNQIVVGPITNLNFPWILLGRAISHLRLICQRTHAQRELMEVEHATGSKIVSEIPHTQRRAVQQTFTRASKMQTPRESELAQLAILIADLASNPVKDSDSN